MSRKRNISIPRGEKYITTHHNSTHGIRVTMKILLKGNNYDKPYGM